VYALRREVSASSNIIPQELEVDEDDQIAAHVAALLDDRVIETLPIMRQGRIAKIGRMAVAASSRKEGVARKLMEFAAGLGRGRRPRGIVLGAQLTACDFYKRLGYVEEGPIFNDVGLPHVMMDKKLRT
jgi:predicted GNAT family N-acyltransferase